MPSDQEKPAKNTAVTAKKKSSSAKKGKLRAFHGNTFDDYFDSAMRDFPLPGRIALGIAVYGCGFWTKFRWYWKFENDEKLVGGDKRPRVVVMNHTSMLDPVVMIVHLWLRGIRIRTIYKSEFDKSPIVSWAFSRVGAIPIKRGTADIKAIRRAVASLKRGEWVLIFPEGTRIKSDDEPVEIHEGYALIAQMAHVPVQPVGCVGARDITKRGSHLHHFSRVFLKAGDLIEFSDINAKSRKEQAEAMSHAGMDAVYKLRDELRQEHPGRM
ncbi:MAG: lysophospholipid acyltransferase family protein [Tractidigestivibacter sp.]|jgi:1-acyl-sn-glycerol-3-phosphate acyltransferase|uniref:lysophospholipid acyltransferase family protein n=1 Tax=Tractidigestivibacter sp. TaxID=2847320 RepID=UPI003D8A9EF8